MAKTTKATVLKKATTKPAAKKATTLAKKEVTTAKKTTTRTTTPTKKITAKATIKKTATVKPVEKKVAAKKSTIPKKTSPSKNGTIKRFSNVDVIVEAMLDKKAQRVVSLDLSDLGTAICDYFIIANADSTTNVLAIADNVEKEMFEKTHEHPIRVQGKENAIWIILDYVDIVVHIFQTEYRQFYRLEELWADAERKDYNDEPVQKKKK